MISCLTDYIGLREVQTDPSSGLYVNDLPGITTEEFQLTRSQENATLSEEWTAIEGRAIRGFENDIKVRLKKYFKNHSVLSTDVTGYVNDNVIVDHGSGVYSGVLLDFYNESHNLKISFDHVKINLTGSATFNIKIFDATVGTQLSTQSVSGVAGLNTVKIKKEYSSFDYPRLFICYDTVLPYKMYDVPNAWTVTSQKISTGATVLSDNMTADETGLSVAYSVKCGIDEFVCNKLSAFQESYMYRLGIEFLKQSKYSTRFSRFTLLGQEKANTMLNEFMMEYEKCIDGVLSDMKVNDDGVCFICNKAINSKVLIP